MRTYAITTETSKTTEDFTRQFDNAEQAEAYRLWLRANGPTGSSHTMTRIG